jgi:sigma-54 dependent transcriptional regulator, acetoin dehydrogenase operon transcriptional activator AcoR
MPSPSSAPTLLSGSHLREARRLLQQSGELSPALADTPLGRSWQRSHRFGLEPAGRAPGAPHASAAQLARARERQRELLAHAQPVMELLISQTQDSDSLVILADAQGLLLQALGDAHFADRAQRVALRPGAIWHEQWRGTNAIGTALVERAPMVVHGGEHYLERNSFLTCTAAPILDPAGRVLGALDISGEQRGYHRHTLGLVRTAARMIEHRLFETRHAGGLRLRLHGQPEGLGTVTEGLLALSDEGWLIGANPAALALLGLDWQALGRCSIEQVLGVEPLTLRDWGRRPGASAHALHRPDGRVLWLRVEGGGLKMPTPPHRAELLVAPPVCEPADALARLDSGDPALHAVIERARRVRDKAIAVLLQGESGVGKEVFVRALHASSARRGQALIALNCAALPEALIEAELFGYRAGAFTGAAREGAPGRIREAQGGTLFLDEIGDMPLALQARLLRVLQEREVQPLGGGRPVAVDFALVCASHRSLREEVAAGRFREDLFYRINGLTLRLPPLRERQDLPALQAAMLAELAPGRELALAPPLALAMARYAWPGNLRELHNALRTACALLDEHEVEIGWEHLPEDLAQQLSALPPPAPELDSADLRAQSQRTVEQVLQSCAGNLSEAARRLGISRNTLYRKLRGGPGAQGAQG